MGFQGPLHASQPYSFRVSRRFLSRIADVKDLPGLEASCELRKLSRRAAEPLSDPLSCVSLCSPYGIVLDAN